MEVSVDRSIALFIHLLGMLTLFTAMAIVQRTGARMRTASTVEELRLWLSLARTTGPMWPSSLVFILGSGLYLAGTGFSFETPFVVTAIVTILVIGVVGGAFVGRGMAAMGQAAGSAGGLTPQLREQVTSPPLWIAATTLNGLALGVLWIMVDKPGWAQSIGVVVALGVVGAVAGVVMTRRGQVSSSDAVTH
jgi:hypothetical protein